MRPASKGSRTVNVRCNGAQCSVVHISSTLCSDSIHKKLWELVGLCLLADGIGSIAVDLWGATLNEKLSLPI